MNAFFNSLFLFRPLDMQQIKWVIQHIISLMIQAVSRINALYARLNSNFGLLKMY